MKKYQKYKNSGVGWLGEIPASWVPTKLKYVGFLYGGLAGKSGEDFKNEDDSNNKHYINFTNICNNIYISKDDLGQVRVFGGEKQNQVKIGDLFFLMSSESQEDVGKSSVLKDDIGEVYLNSFCKGFRIMNDSINHLFLNYLLHGKNYRDLISIHGNGFTRVNLRQDKVNDFVFFYPTYKEQIQIVAFLDQKASIIDDLIQKKLRKIELLKEQRESIINQAVTKGLNTKIEMKDSGERSIGSIPSHWDITRLKYLVSFDSGYAFKSEDYSTEGVNLIRIGNLYENILDLERSPIYLPVGFIEKYPSFVVKKNDILISLTGTLGKKDYGYSIVYDKEFPSMLNQRVGRLKVVSEDILFQFLTYQLLCDVFLNQLFIKPTGTKQGNLSADDILTNYLPLPTISEQKEIVEYLDKKTSEIDKQVDLENRKIELLKEYRQSLISEVVTGKIDVRTN